MFAEFAIALPLLIFLMYGLAAVSINIFHRSKEQIADYILETEAQYVMERITQEARVAKRIEEINSLAEDVDEIEFKYHTGGADIYNELSVADIWETRYFIPHGRKADEDDDSSLYFANINAKRQRDNESNPISGSLPAGKPNFVPFGDTKINRLKFKLDKEKKILHVAGNGKHVHGVDAQDAKKNKTQHGGLHAGLRELGGNCESKRFRDDFRAVFDFGGRVVRKEHSRGGDELLLRGGGLSGGV